MDAIETSSKVSRAPRLRRRAAGVAVVVVGVALGLGVAFGPRVFDDENATKSRALPSGAVPLASLSTSQVAAATSSAGAIVSSGAPALEPPSAAASSPRDALEGFLNAEAAGQYDVSYGRLSAADRTRAGGRAAWSARHANLPPITGFTIYGVSESGGEASISTSLTLRASLDVVVGLVPARALGTWTAVAEDGGWRVAYARASIEPQYPSDASAPDAARDWASARQACHSAAEWSGGLLGPTSIAKALCHARGSVSVGPATELIDDPTGDLTAAFGSSVYSWARVVPVMGPVRLDLIVAPVGEQWLVIGVREASPDAK